VVKHVLLIAGASIVAGIYAFGWALCRVAARADEWMEQLMLASLERVCDCSIQVLHAPNTRGNWFSRRLTGADGSVCVWE